MLRAEYRKVLAIGAMTGLTMPLFTAPAAATLPGDWPALPPSAPTEVQAPSPAQAEDAPVRAIVREPRGLSGRIYEVRPGDTLWAIAERHLGDPTRWPELFEANRSRLSNPHRLQPKQKISLGAVPQASRASRKPQKTTNGTYTVKPGDTLGKIAQRQLGKASEWPVLYALNRATLASPHQIYPGQVLRMPASRRQTALVAPRARVASVGSKVSRKTDDGRLLKGHRRVNGSYYAKGADGQLVWADTQERVRPNDSTLKTQLAPKIREAFKVPEPTPVTAKKPEAKPAAKPTVARAATPATKSTPKVTTPVIKSSPVRQGGSIFELPASQMPTYLQEPDPSDRLAAGAMSLVVPGVGQLYNGDPLRAGLFLAGGAAGLGTAVYGVANDRRDIGMAAAAGLVALSLWSAADAYLNAPPRPADRTARY